jgi:hypothetical protein
MKANPLGSRSFLLGALFALAFAAHTAAQGQSAPATNDKAASAINDSQSESVDRPPSNIQVENWTKPQSGWLYVLDPKPNAGDAGGHIWLFDPATAKVMGNILTGDNADFALSPDGSRLYVASIVDGDVSELAAVDTTKGTVDHLGTVEDREVGNVIPSFSVMAVSGDGLALRILLDTPGQSEDRDSFLYTALDTRTGEFQHRTVHLGNCGPGRFISYPSANQFDVFCPRTNRVRMISVDDNSRELHNQDVVLPWERRIGVAVAIETPGARDISIVRGDGGVFQMNLGTQEFTDTAEHPALPNRIPPAAWPISPDGGRVYLGYNSDYDRHSDNRFYLDYGRPPNLRPDNATAREFRVLDTSSWRKVGTIKTKWPFWSATLSTDGKTLYAMVPKKQSILVIDTAKMHEISVLKLGGMPTLAVVAP